MLKPVLVQLGEKLMRHEPGGPDLTPLLIHGFLDQGAVWRKVAAALGPLGERALLPDLAGAGRRQAEAAPYTLARACAELVGLINARPGERFVLIGHSMGSQIAELVAAGRPDRIAALVLITAVPLAGGPLPDDLRTLLRNCGGDVEQQRRIRGMFAHRLAESDLGMLLDPATLMGAEAAAGYYDAFTGGDEMGRHPTKYRGPTLLIAASLDPVVSPQQTAAMRDARFPGCALAIIEGSGHWPHLEQPARLAATTASFVTSHVEA
jgi:pimeloyl-ACP methyl ester carboxylesterase